MAQSFITSANTTFSLANPDDRRVARWIISVKKTSGTSFTIKPQKRVMTPMGQTAHTMADCWYTLALSNTPVAAGTTQTTDCIIDIDGSGCTVDLVVTVSSATVEVFAVAIAG